MSLVKGPKRSYRIYLASSITVSASYWSSYYSRDAEILSYGVVY